MSKTTPEEAITLASRHSLYFHEDAADQPENLATLIDEVRGVDTEPVCFIKQDQLAYLRSRPKDDSDATVRYANGFPSWVPNKLRTEYLPLYTHPALSQPAAPVELPVVAWLLEWTFNGEERGQRLYDDERHCLLDAQSDGGICSPLVKLSDAQAAIAAGRKVS